MKRFIHFAAALCILGLGACTRTRDCKAGTVLLSLSFDGVTAGADALRVDVAVGNGDAVDTQLTNFQPTATGSIEVDFSGAYPAGDSITVDVIASQAGADIGSGHAATILEPTCTTLSVPVVGGGVDAGVDASQDAAPQADLSGDMLLLPQVSQPPNWLPGTALPSPTYGLAAATGKDGVIYAIGGAQVNTTTGVVSYPAAVQQFDGLSWAAPTNLLIPAAYLAASIGSDGLIYVTGGGSPTATGIVQAHNPGGTSWNSSLPKMHTPRSSHASVAYSNGRIYVISGADDMGNLTATVESYAPGDTAWDFTSAPALPLARTGLAAAVGADGRIYAIGGFNMAMGGHQSRVDSWKPGEASWTQGADLPTARDGLAAVAAPDGRIYAISGSTKTITYLQTVEAFDPAANKWTTATTNPIAPLIMGRPAGAATVGPDGRLYYIGGGNFEGGLSSVEVYGPVFSLSPNHAAPGQVVTVAGSNFGASAGVAVYLGAPGGNPLTTAVTDAQGKLPTMNFVVPNVASNGYVITVEDTASRYPVTARFAVP